MPERLTERRCTTAPSSSSRISVTDTEARGLELRITPSGRKSWYLKVSVDNRDRRIKLDNYQSAEDRNRSGLKSGLTLAEARDEAGAMRALVRAGHDPVADRLKARAKAEQLARESEARSLTLQGLLDAYEEARSSDPQDALPKTWREMESEIRRVFKRQIPLPLDKLTAEELRAALSRHAQTAPVAAKNAGAYLRPILYWGQENYTVSRDLVAAVTPTRGRSGTSASRDMVLRSDQLIELLPYFSSSTGIYGLAARFLLLTAQRRDEVAGSNRYSDHGLRWGDIDQTRWLWHQSAAANKSRRKHQVPISKTARDLLDEVAELNTKRGLSNASHDRVFPNDAGGPLTNWGRWRKGVVEQTGIAGWQQHDLRRTAATMMAELGTTPEVIERILNHAPHGGGLTSVYQRYGYLPEMSAALEKLGEWINNLAKGPTAEIVPLTSKRTIT